MPYGLFRALRVHIYAPLRSALNECPLDIQCPAQYSDIVEHTPHFYPHIGAGPKVIHPPSCKHDVDTDLLTLASYNKDS